MKYAFCQTNLFIFEIYKNMRFALEYAKINVLFLGIRSYKMKTFFISFVINICQNKTNQKKKKKE